MKQFVICPICNEELEQICYQHVKSHGITMDEFRTRFPSVELCSEELNNKRSISMKGNVIRLGKLHTAEALEKMRIASTGRKHTEETKTKISESSKGKIISDEQRKQLSEFRTGKTIDEICSKEGAEKFRTKMSVRMSGKNNPRYGKIPAHGKWCMTLKGHWVRSTWEMIVCNWLFLRGILYEYEPRTFDFGNFTYTPDLYLPDRDLWIEIKGWYDKMDIIKIETFQNDYGNICVIDKQNIHLFMEE